MDAGLDADGHSLALIRIESNDALKSQDHIKQDWLIVRDSGTVLAKRAIVGWGPACEGTEDEILRVSTNSLYYHCWTGGMHTYGIDATLRLWPLAITQSGWHTGGTATGDPTRYETDWQTLTSTVTVGFYTEEERYAWATVPDKASRHEITFLAIPNVGLRREFRKNGWKLSVLGSCALTMSPNTNGHIVFGSTQASKYPEIKTVLISDKELLVQVRLTTSPTSGSSSWLNDDHLELWLNLDPSRDIYLDGPHDGGKLVQWGIRVSDGKVFPAYGHPSVSPQVERLEREPNLFIFKMTLPVNLEGTGREGNITLAYSESDAGKRVKRIIATSNVHFVYIVSMGGTFRVSENIGYCQDDKGQLNFVLDQHFRPYEPLLMGRQINWASVQSPE